MDRLDGILTAHFQAEPAPRSLTARVLTPPGPRGSRRDDSWTGFGSRPLIAAFRGSGPSA